MSTCRVVNSTTGQLLAGRARLCDTFFSRFRGLMLRRRVAGDEVLVFQEPAESIAGASIHMFLVFCPIAVIWLDRGRRVVDSRLARPFRLYAPRRPAQYFVEGHPTLLEQVHPGDIIEWDNG